MRTRWACSLVVTVLTGFVLLAGPGLKQSLTFSPEGFSSLELEFFWTEEAVSASLGGRWEETGFAYGEVGGSLYLEPVGVLADFGIGAAGDWEASLGGELTLPPLSLLATVSFGRTGVTAWNVEGSLSWEILSLQGKFGWEGGLWGALALHLSPGPVFLGAGLSLSADEGLSELRGGIGVSGDLGTAAFQTIYTPSLDELLFVTEFDLQSEHLSVGFTAVWNPFPRGEVHPAADMSGEPYRQGILRYLEELRVEASLATPPREAGKPPAEPMPLLVISSPKGSTFMVGEEITFSARGSRSAMGPWKELMWEFGDGTRAWGMEVRHCYTFPGLYRVVLIARDVGGTPHRAERILRILAPELVADFTWEPEEPTVLDEVCFVDHSRGEIVSWHWDFGDGTSSDISSPCHQYEAKGEYQVSLTVADRYGNEATAVKVLTVVNLPPHPDPNGPYQGVVYQEIVFSAKGSYDPDGHIVEYHWDFGDGTTAQGEVVSHAYPEPGIYEVCLYVVDDDGAGAEACTTAEVMYYPEVGGCP